MLALVDTVLDSVGSLDGPWLWAIAFGLAFGETALFADLVVPGEVGMVVVGAAAARGDDSVVPIIVAATLGAIVGDTVSYLVGRHFGLRLIRKWEPLRRRLEPAVERSRGFFARYGGGAVFLGRFVGALRAVVPAVAGMSGMSYPRFLPWNVAASVLWTSSVILLGFLVGEPVADLVDRAGTAVSVVVVSALVLGYLVYRWRRGRRDVEAA